LLLLLPLDALLLASQSLPALVLPFFVGHIFDIFEFKYVTLGFLAVQMTGQLSFCLALHLHSFSCAVAALVLFGSGSSAVSVAQRALVVSHYRGSEGFGIGCLHSLASVAKCVGKLSLVPAVLLLRSYQWALLCMCGYSVGSLAVALYLLCGGGAPVFLTHDASALAPAPSPSITITAISTETRTGIGGRPRANSTSVQSFGFW
jgi:hypothetical protein